MALPTKLIKFVADFDDGPPLRIENRADLLSLTPKEYFQRIILPKYRN